MRDDGYRIERDLIGEAPVPAGALHGIHTERALENFPLAGRPVQRGLVEAYGTVKLACARTNRALGAWADEAAKAEAIEQACREMADGLLTAHVVVDALQGGAGTSTNMNVNEVLANRALEILGEPHGAYGRVSPADDINLHQTTNDTYPTALRLAAIRLLHDLEEQVVALQEAFQEKERQFAHVVKVGRTQLQDAVLTTLGREMGAYAEAFNRDRWRIYKCEERLRVVNLGGTAIGTGLAAPRQYIFRVVDTLREITVDRLRPRREPRRGDPERRRLRRGLGHPQGARRHAAQGRRRPAPDVLGAGGRAGRDPAAAAAGRLLHHARQGQPGHPRGGDPGRDARDGLRPDHRRRRGPRAARAQPLPAAGRRVPAREPVAAGRAPTRSSAGTASRASRPTKRAAALHVETSTRRGHRAGARDRLRGGDRGRRRARTRPAAACARSPSRAAW